MEFLIELDQVHISLINFLILEPFSFLILNFLESALGLPLLLDSVLSLQLLIDDLPCDVPVEGIVVVDLVEE